MAYNPFNIFRKNQKAIFAVVTVVIMFVFVLSSGLSGKADFFNTLQDWFRGRSSKGDALCSIDGTKIHPRDVEALRFQRVVANKFMQQAGLETFDSMRKSLLDLSSKASPENEFIFKAVLQARNQFEFQQFAGLAARVKDNPNSKETDKEAASLIEAMASLMQSGGRISPIPFSTDRDMIDFMLWQQKAKQLGIQFNEDDAKSLVQKEFMGNFKSDVQARKALRDEYRERYTDELLFKALAAEFEVRAAFSAVLGVSTRPDQTLTAPMTASVPYELFKYFQEKTSPTKYEALRIPVESFIPLVTANPSEDDLLKLFNSRKDYEPDPAKEEAGFREPRKVKVEWVSVLGDEPYYKKAAADWLSRTELLAKSEVRALMVPFPGANPAVVAAHIAGPAAMKEPLVHEKYKREVVNRHEARIGFGWGGPSSTVLHYDILETSTVKPQNLVAAAGGAAGGIGFGNPLLPVSLLYTATVAAEQKARIKAGMPLFLGAVPGPSMLPTMIASEAAFRKNVPEPLPLDAYKPLLLQELSEGKARELAVNDLKQLKKSIDDLKETGKSREAAAKDLVAEFVKTRGIKTGASTEFQGEYTIGDDPGLAPLKALKDKGQDGMDPHLGRTSGPVQFGRAFFWKPDFGGRSREPATGNFIPEFYPDRTPDASLNPFAKPEPVFLAWRTADQSGSKQSYSEAKPRVIEAWKRIKARDLAKAEAERFANEVRNKPGESEFLISANLLDLQAQLLAKTTSPKARELVRTFAIDNVAPFQITMDFSNMQMGRGGGETVVPFRLAPSNDIPFPTPEMAKQLLEERTKPPRTVFVQVDQPKDSYYVVALLDRKVRGVEDFKPRFFSPLMPNQVGMGLTQRRMFENLEKSRDSVLALMKKEFKYEESEEQKKRLDDRQKNAIDE